MEDSRSLKLWLTNEIVCSLSIEGESYPTVQEVRNNWQFSYHKLNDVTDEEIEKIIRNVKRTDNYHG